MMPAEEDDVPGGLEPFAAQVAHEFNNLLTGVLGNLELLEMRAARNKIEGLESYLSGARNAGARAAGFAHRLLVYSGRTARPAEPVEVTALLRTLAGQPEGRGVAMTLPPQPLFAMADPDGLQQAVVELIENAREAAPASRALALRAALQDGMVCIEMRDDGPGMAPEVLAQAAEPLFTTRANGAGRGLGLAIAARSVERAGGTLVLDSAPGQGCVARLLLRPAEG